jgi:hypothetical protein
MKSINKIVLLTVLCLVVYVSNAQQTCGNKKLCGKEDLGDSYDFRGQSTFGRLSPGDTSRVKAVLYSKNDVRILVCSDPSLGDVNFRILKTIREYNRTIDKIEKSTTEEPIYKTDKEGNPVAVLDDWGEPKKDDLGQIQYEIIDYKPVTKIDTIWKTERKTREDVLFDSRKGKKVFEEEMKKTESVIIEVVVPETTDEKMKKYEGCVAIMVGRMYHYVDYKKFGK